MDLFEQLRRSVVEFATRLRQVGPDDWGRATPCEEWDVRALVNHVVGGSLRYTMLLHGATADEVAATRAVDHLDGDALTAFDRRAAEVTAAFHEPGARSRTVHHPAGDRSGEELLGLRITEFAVHAWDLSRAVGAPDQLDSELVEAMWARLSSAGTGLERGGYFRAPAGTLPDDAPRQVQLLHLAGRQP